MKEIYTFLIEFYRLFMGAKTRLKKQKKNTITNYVHKNNKKPNRQLLKNKSQKMNKKKKLIKKIKNKS